MMSEKLQQMIIRGWEVEVSWWWWWWLCCWLLYSLQVVVIASVDGCVWASFILYTLLGGWSGNNITSDLRGITSDLKFVWIALSAICRLEVDQCMNLLSLSFPQSECKWPPCKPWRKFWFHTSVRSWGCYNVLWSVLVKDSSSLLHVLLPAHVSISEGMQTGLSVHMHGTQFPMQYLTPPST